MRVHRVTACLLAALFPSSISLLLAGEGSEPERKTHKVAAGPFKIELTLEGVFEPRESQSIVLRPDAWTELTLRDVVAAGTTVAAGDTLITLDATKIDEAIRDAESTFRTQELELAELEAEILVAKQLTPRDVADAQRAHEISLADYKYFTEVERQEETKQVDFMLKMFGNFLSYAEEELKQLEKMYQADDLMEETEEIILKQQRDQVEQIKFYIEASRVRREHIVGTELPRREHTLKEAMERAGVAHDKARQTLPLALGKLEVRLAKEQEEQRRNADKLARLREDRKLFIVKAPTAGVVYYGECGSGDWSHPEAVTKLRRGASLSAHEVLMTIVPLRPLDIRATVPEKELADVKPGAATRVVPTAWPEAKLAGTIESAARLPDAAGKYVGRIKLSEELPSSVSPVPGMTCNVKLTAYQRDDALTVPAKAVFHDEQNDEHYVYLTVDGKPTRRNVSVGRHGDSQSEITAGLAAGDSILLEKPGD